MKMIFGDLFNIFEFFLQKITYLIVEHHFHRRENLRITERKLRNKIKLENVRIMALLS